MDGTIPEEGQQPPARISPTGVPLDTAVKVLEITAKEIVDRISSAGDSEFSAPGSSSSSPKRGSEVRTVSETSISSTRSGRLNSSAEETLTAAAVPVIPAAPSVSTAASSEVSLVSTANTSMSSQVSPSSVSDPEPKSSSPVQSKRTQKLLAVLQHWIKDVHEKKGKKDGEVFQSNVLHDNLYYLSSIESFIRDLPHSSQDALAQKFSTNLLNWIKHLFHFQDACEGDLEYNQIIPHWEKEEGFLTMARWQLHNHFPNFLFSGFDTFAQEDRLPVIYCSDEDIGIQVTSSLGLSKECFSLVETMDNDWVNSFEELILFDKKRNMTPIIFLVNIGKTSKNVEKGCHLCELHQIPVHIFGRNTFSYFAKRPESDQVGTSFTIDLNPWIPSPAVPHLTIYKKALKTDQTRLQLCGLLSRNKNLQLLAPWFCTEAFGPINTKSHIEEVCELGQFLLTLLKKYSFLSIISNWSTLTDGQVIVSSLIFRFTPTFSDADSKLTNGEVSEPPSPQYVNVLNSWLYHIFERDFKEQLHIEFVDVGGNWHILFDVLKTPKFTSAEEAGIEKMFEHHMQVLHSTVAKKREFSKLVAETTELEDVDYDSSWAGLGAVRYIPKFYREEASRKGGVNGPDVKRSPPPVPPHEDPGLHRKSNINHLNAQIVDKLKAIDNAFSLGVYGDGDWCVQFGMVTDETEVFELLRLVISTGEDIEESSEFFQQMSELVKKGIERATEELKRESEEAMWEEGILRRVPVVGTFVNWFSPPARESGIRGRALNLAQGRVESTENIYKYHMQVEAPSSPTPESNNILSRLSFSK